MVVFQAQLHIRVAYGSSKDIAVYQAIGLQPDQIYIIGRVAKKHRKEAVVCVITIIFSFPCFICFFNSVIHLIS